MDTNSARDAAVWFEAANEAITVRIALLTEKWAAATGAARQGLAEQIQLLAAERRTLQASNSSDAAKALLKRLEASA